MDASWSAISKWQTLMSWFPVRQGPFLHSHVKCSCSSTALWLQGDIDPAHRLNLCRTSPAHHCGYAPSTTWPLRPTFFADDLV